MAFEELKSLITQNVRTNGTESITGAIMQGVLLSMVNELGGWAEGVESPFATRDWVSTQLQDYATLDALGRKQDTLVSGTNIKTINGESILGNGNIVIEQGGGDYLPLAGGTLTGNLVISQNHNLNIHYQEDVGLSNYSYWNAYLYKDRLSFRYTGYGQEDSSPLDIVYIPAVGDYSQLNVGGKLQAYGFYVPGGNNNMFLKAGGGVDTNEYLTTSVARNTYLPLIGGGVIQSTTATYRTYLYPDKVSVQYNDIDNDSSYGTELNPLGLFFKETDEEYICLRRYASQIRFQLEEGDYAYIRGGGFIINNGDNSNVILDGGGIRTLGNVGGTWLGTCTTAATTPAKTVSLSNFILYQNITISVRFTNAINVPDATLNVNSTGAKPIKINGEALQYGVIKAGMTAVLQYDGSSWNIVSLMGAEQPSIIKYAVDLGLPSGLLWADRNVDVETEDGFALHEYDQGSYFSWGNGVGHNPSGTTFSYDFGTSNGGPYASTKGAAVTANLSPQMDMARVNCGAPWRQPSRLDFQELYDNCTWTWTTVSGVNGYLVTSNANNNTIFLPAAGYGNGTSLSNLGSGGYYWSSSFHSSANAYILYFHSGGIYPQHYNLRFLGFSVRAVQ